MASIRLSWKGGETFGSLDDTPTGRKLAEALPCTSQAHTWGEEVYFDLPIDTNLEANATDVVDPGTICYWVQGGSVALPYGPTPASVEGESRLVTAVNIAGKLDGDPRILAGIEEGGSVTVALVKESP